VRPDEEIGDQARSTVADRAARLSPQAARGPRRLGRDGLEDNAKKGERTPEVVIVSEMGSYLSPHNITGHERTCVVSAAQGVARCLTELRVGAQDIEQH